MHRDLHHGNILRRKRARPFDIVLKRVDEKRVVPCVHNMNHSKSIPANSASSVGSSTPTPENAASSLRVRCDNEFQMVDFDMSWISSQGSILCDGSNLLYPRMHEWNLQHDLRQLVTSLYTGLCIDWSDFSECRTTQCQAAQWITSIVHQVKSTSERYRIRMNLERLRTLRWFCLRSRRSPLDLQSWDETFASIRQHHMWDAEFNEYEMVFQKVWENDSPIAITHMMYGSMIKDHQTPIFEPTNLLSSYVSYMKNK